VTLPLLPDGWSRLPGEQRRQWEQLQRQHAQYEWRRSAMLQRRAHATASPARLAGRFGTVMMPVLLVLLALAVFMTAFR
jgi:hypothetical protein